MRFLSLTLASCLFLLLSVHSVSAQSGQTGVAIPVTITGEQPQEGDIICTGKTGYAICKDTYSTSMFGVLTTAPAAAFESAPQPDRYLVLTYGRALVRVSNKNGVIKKGDLLTSTAVSGVAGRASKNGYVLGLALDDYAPQNPDDVGLLAVSLNIHPTTIFIDVRSNLLEALREGLAAPVLTPLAALRYMLAALVTIASFMLGFVYFGRLARTGIEAIGRNPLARLQIQTSVIINLVLMTIIFLGGLGLSYFILVL